MTTYDLDLLTTLVVATALYFLGHFLVRRVPVLASYSIPVPVVGGVLGSGQVQQLLIGLAIATAVAWLIYEIVRYRRRARPA